MLKHPFLNIQDNSLYVSTMAVLGGTTDQLRRTFCVLYVQGLARIQYQKNKGKPKPGGSGPRCVYTTVVQFQKIASN